MSLQIELRFGDQVLQHDATRLDVSLHWLTLATRTVNTAEEQLVPVINCEVSAEFEGFGVQGSRKETPRRKIKRPTCHSNKTKNNCTHIPIRETTFVFKFQKL